MRLLATLSILFSMNSFAAELGYCQKEAESEVLAHHEGKLRQIGVIQGYGEDIEVKYEKTQTQLDNLTEVYTYEITGGNDEGDYWTTKYEVRYDTWLSAGPNVEADCGLMKMIYFGIVAEGNVWEEM